MTMPLLVLLAAIADLMTLGAGIAKSVDAAHGRRQLGSLTCNVAGGTGFVLRL